MGWQMLPPAIACQLFATPGNSMPAFCYPRSIACQLFATPRNCCALSYSCIIVVAVVAKEMSPKIVDKLNLGVCDIPESSIVSCTQLSIGLRQYIV